MTLTYRQATARNVTILVILSCSVLFPILISVIVNYTGEFVDYTGISEAISRGNSNIRENSDLFAGERHRTFIASYSISAYFWKINLIVSLILVLFHVAVQIRMDGWRFLYRRRSIFVTIFFLLMTFCAVYFIYFKVGLFLNEGRKSTPPNVFGLVIYSICSAMPSISLFRIFSLVPGTKP